MTFLARSRFAHELAALDGLLLACRHAGMPVGLQVIGHPGALMMHRRVKRQQPCRPVLDDPPARVAPAMEPTRVTCGTFAPTCPRHLVCRDIGRLAPHKHPRRTACVLDTFFRLGWFGPHNTIHFGEIH